MAYAFSLIYVRQRTIQRIVLGSRISFGDFLLLCFCPRLADFTGEEL